MICSTMATKIHLDSSVAEAAERAVVGLVQVSHWGGSSYVNLPLFMPSGTPASVRVTRQEQGFRVDDGGFAYRELEAIGAERSFAKAAARFAAYEELSADRRLVFTHATETELSRAISDVGTASYAVATDVYRRLAEGAAVEVEEYLRERLEEIFAGARIESEEEIKGASSHSWKVTAALHRDSEIIVFQAVNPHPYSVYKTSTAFRDLSDLPHPPRCISVVRDKAAMGVNLNVLAQAGRVIQSDQPDEAYRRAAA
jgi:hypothetical protein